MSFSSDVKNELYNLGSDDVLIKKAEVYGLLLFSKNFSLDLVSLETKNRKVIEQVFEFLAVNLGAIIEVKTKLSHKKGGVMLLTVPYLNDRENILRFFYFGSSKKQLLIDYKNLQSEKQLSAFLRGVFLICGSVTDPNKEYRLEFSVQNSALANELYNVLSDLEINLVPRLSKKKNKSIIYIKENEQVSDFLVYIGAKNSAMEFMQVKMVKEVRNYVNRTTNFQTANLDKTAAAAAVQIRDIEYITREKGLDYLSYELREIAEIRMQNPDMSLKEIGEGLSKPISRSGVNHRLKKIMNIADEIRKKRD